MDQILQDCSHTDVLNCALVSKSWNSSARDFLWRQRNTLLSLRRLETVEELEGVAELMENNILGGNQPFRGMVLEFHEGDGRLFNQEEDLQEILHNRKLLQRIFAKIATDHVTLTHLYYNDENEFLQQTVHRIYRNYATAVLVDSMTSLSIRHLTMDCGGFVKPLGETNFPNLKLIDSKCPGNFINDNCTVDDIEKLSALCPALEWHGPIELQGLIKFLDFKIVANVKTLKIDESDLPSEDTVLVETAGLKLKRLILTWQPVKNIAPKVAKIIQSSRESLEEIWLHRDALKEFQHYQGFPCFGNVRRIYCDYEEDDGDEIFQEGTNPCLQHIFPKAILEFTSIYENTMFDFD